MQLSHRSLAPILLLAGLATGLSVIPAQAQVGVSIQLGQPGYYGPVYPTGIPTNQLLYPQPVLIQPGVGLGYGGWGGNVQPIYLRVPPGHAKNWRNYCQRYGACNRPVYFVRDTWYNDNYGPRYRQQRYDNRGRPGPRMYVNPGWNQR